MSVYPPHRPAKWLKILEIFSAAKYKAPTEAPAGKRQAANCAGRTVYAIMDCPHRAYKSTVAAGTRIAGVSTQNEQRSTYSVSKVLFVRFKNTILRCAFGSKGVITGLPLGLTIAALERERLSSDIHEGLGQELTGIALLLKGMRTDGTTDHAHVESKLDELVTHVSHAISVARNLAAGLSPLQVMHGSLEWALRALAIQCQDRFQIQIGFTASANIPALTPVMADHLYRIAHDGISNAARHSGCSKVEIALLWCDHQITLIIEDNGSGLTPSGYSASGMGLRMIAYRATMMDGSATISSPAGGGTRVEVTAPLAAGPVPSSELQD